MRLKPLVICALALVLAPLAAPQIRVDPRVAGAAALTPWRSVGPDGGTVESLSWSRLNPNLVFAGVGNLGRLFKSVDGGGSWARLAAPTGSGTLAVAPSNPNVVYHLDYGQFHRSGNAGAAWTTRSFPSGAGGYALAIPPRDPNVVFVAGYRYAGSGYQAITLKSVNGGANWSTVLLQASSSYPSFYWLAVSPADPNRLLLSGYVGGAYRLYRSTNGGASWEAVSGTIGNSQVWSVAFDPVDPLKAYASTGGAVFRTADGGSTWTRNTGTAWGYAVGVDPQNPANVYVGYNKQVYKSVDGGATWASKAGMMGNCTAIGVAGIRVLYGGSSGVYRSADGGTAWEPGNAGLRASNVVAVAISKSAPNVIYAEAGGDGFYRSADFGSTWTRCPDFYRCESIRRIAVHPTNPDEVYILAGG